MNSANDNEPKYVITLRFNDAVTGEPKILRLDRDTAERLSNDMLVAVCAIDNKLERK